MNEFMQDLLPPEHNQVLVTPIRSKDLALLLHKALVLRGAWPSHMHRIVDSPSRLREWLCKHRDCNCGVSLSIQG